MCVVVMHPLSRLHSTLRCIALRYHFVLSTCVLLFSFAQTHQVYLCRVYVIDFFFIRHCNEQSDQRLFKASI